MNEGAGGNGWVGAEGNEPRYLALKLANESAAEFAAFCAWAAHWQALFVEEFDRS
jgi:hypothetical protein